jgi:hypothetical protein
VPQRAARGPPPCVGAAAVVPALVAGDVLSSAVSGRAYQVLRTVADGRMGHGRHHVLLARHVCAAGGDGGNGGCGHLRMVIKV